MGYELFRKRLGEFFHGAAFGQYEASLRQQTAELNDLFLLLCFHSFFDYVLSPTPF